MQYTCEALHVSIHIGCHILHAIKVFYSFNFISLECLKKEIGAITGSLLPQSSLDQISCLFNQLQFYYAVQIVDKYNMHMSHEQKI